MTARSGEKVGWICGWCGGFVWLLILSVIWLVQKHLLVALIGLSLVGLAVACILWFAPWRHPKTAYWKLFLPIYLILFAAIGLAVLTGGFTQLQISWWSLSWLLPVLIPFVTAGKRSWDGSASGRRTK